MADVARITGGRFVSFCGGFPSSALSAALLPDCDAAGFGVVAEGAGVLEEATEEAECACGLDWDRCRMESSEGFLRWSRLLDARWPGVWLRGTGAGGSEASESSDSSDSSLGAVGDVAAIIFCERTTRDLRGDRGAASPEALVESPMTVGGTDHGQGHRDLRVAIELAARYRAKDGRLERCV